MLRKSCLLTPFLSLGCLSTLESEDTADSAPVTTGETLVVQVQGQETCGICADLPSDHMAYLTPTTARLGVLAVDLMRASNDADPVRVMEASPPMILDLAMASSLASVDTGRIPEGTYGYVRLHLASFALEVPSRGHFNGTFLGNGTFGIDLCLGDHDSETESDRRQGEYAATFTILGQDLTLTGSAVLMAYPPSTNCAAIDTSGGAFLLTLAAATPVVVSHAEPASVRLDVSVYIEQVFGWTDLPAAGFETGAFDVAPPPESSEMPAFFLPRGYDLAVGDAGCGG